MKIYGGEGNDRERGRERMRILERKVYSSGDNIWGNIKGGISPGDFQGLKSKVECEDHPLVFFSLKLYKPS